MSDKQNLYIDKLSLSRLPFMRALDIIGIYELITMKRRKTFIDDENIGEHKDFISCWGEIFAQYNFLLYQKINPSKLIAEVSKQEMACLMKKYRSGEHLTYEDLTKAFDYIIEFTSKCGYMDDTALNTGGDSWDDEEFI